MVAHHKHLAPGVESALFIGLALPVRAGLSIIKAAGLSFMVFYNRAAVKNQGPAKIPGSSERGGGPGGLVAAEPRWSGFCENLGAVEDKRPGPELLRY